MLWKNSSHCRKGHTESKRKLRQPSIFYATRKVKSRGDSTTSTTYAGIQSGKARVRRKKKQPQDSKSSRSGRKFWGCSVITQKPTILDTSTRIEAIDILPCIGIQCKMDRDEKEIFNPDNYSYKILTSRARFISTSKGKAKLFPNTSVSEVSAPRLARNVRRRKVQTSNEIEPEDEVLIPRPYIPAQKKKIAMLIFYKKCKKIRWRQRMRSLSKLADHHRK